MVLPGETQGRCAEMRVLKNSVDNGAIFDAGDDLHRPATVRADLSVDIEYSLQALRPTHRDVARRRSPFPALLALRRAATALSYATAWATGMADITQLADGCSSSACRPRCARCG